MKKNILMCWFSNPPSDSTYNVEMDRLTSLFVEIFSVMEFDYFKSVETSIS